MKRKIIYYTSFSEDIITNRRQDYEMPETYNWIPEQKSKCRVGTGTRLYILAAKKLWGDILYRIALHIADFYCRFILRATLVGAEKLTHVQGKGFFLYANHTQPQGDVFLPAWVVRQGTRQAVRQTAHQFAHHDTHQVAHQAAQQTFWQVHQQDFQQPSQQSSQQEHASWRRCYTIVSPANLGLPIIGKILPTLGALPLPVNTKQYAHFEKAMAYRLAQGCGIAIFPEAHVWPYYTKIRPFGDTSFSYPVAYDCPAYCMTVTYQKNGKWKKKPDITIYIDGPFEADTSLHKKDARRALCKQVRTCMEQRSKESNYEYYRYEKICR